MYVFILLSCQSVYDERKSDRKLPLCLIAIMGRIISFVVYFIMQEEFRCLTGITQSVFWAVIAYLVLKSDVIRKAVIGIVAGGII